MEYYSSFISSTHYHNYIVIYRLNTVNICEHNDARSQMGMKPEGKC